MGQIERRIGVPMAGVVVAGLILAAIVLLGAGVAGARADDSPEAAPSALATTHTRAEIEAAEKAGEESQLPAGEPVEGAGLDRAQSLELMEGDFGGYLEASAGVFDELHVQEFLSNSAAVVGDREQERLGYEGTPPGPALLESSIPLRTDSAVPGVLQPVNLSLEHSEGEIQPVNPLVEVGIPSELGDGIQLPNTEIRLAGAAGSRVPTVSPSGAAFYPEVLEDTDLAVAPSPTGVETFTQLRSAEAPTEETYDFSLPAGAEFVQMPDGEIKAMEGTEELFFVTPPTAVDAEGNPVSAEVSIDGPSISVKVHPTASAAYPIMVDPSIEDLYHWESGTENHIGWTPYRTPTSAGPNTYNEPVFACTTYCYLYTSANAGGWIWENTQTYWGYTVPRFQSDYEKYGIRPTDWISCLVTGNLVFSRGGDTAESPRAISDISNESGGWVSTYMWGTDLTGGFSNCTTSNLGRLAAFGLFGTSDSLLAHPRYFLVGYSQVLLNDVGSPVIKELPEPSHWVNASLQPFEVMAEDTGLGVSSVQVSKSNGEAIWTVPAKAPGGANCTGTTRAPCPRRWSNQEAGNEVALNTASLPQGKNVLRVVAGDPVGNTGLKEVPIYVDHTEPELGVAGSLLEQGTIGTNLAEYTVAVSAQDGTSAAPQSGVANVELKVDGKLRNTESGWAPGCKKENCPLEKTWTLKSSEYGTGKHTLEVVTHDAVGLASTPKMATFEITRDTTVPQVVGSGALIEGPKGWIEQGSHAAFHGEVKDPAGSGAALLELKVSGAKPQSKSGSCPRGGCTLSENFTVNTAALSGGTHTVTLVGKDAAGNAKEESWTINVDPVGVASVSEATKTMQAMENTSGAEPIAPVSEVEPPQEVAEGNDPSLKAEGKLLVSEGVPVESSISTETNAIEMETPAGKFVMEPTTASGSPPSIENGVAAVSPNTGTAWDTTTRPEFDGVMQFETIRSAAAPEQYLFHVKKGPRQSLKQIDPTDIGLFDEAGVESVLVTAEEAWDAVGHRVESTVAIVGPEEIAMTVHHRAGGVVYPVVAGAEPQTGYSFYFSTLKEPVREAEEEQKAREQSEHEALQHATEGNENPTLELGAPEPDAGNPPPGTATASSLPTRHRGLGVTVCSNLNIEIAGLHILKGCESWWRRLKMFFHFNGSYAWWNESGVHPNCYEFGEATGVSQTLEYCDWNGPNYQSYGAGYHISASMFLNVQIAWQQTPNNYTMYMYGDGYANLHKTASICNPLSSCE